MKLKQTAAFFQTFQGDITEDMLAELSWFMLDSLRRVNHPAICRNGTVGFRSDNPYGIILSWYRTMTAYSG